MSSEIGFVYSSRTSLNTISIKNQKTPEMFGAFLILVKKRATKVFF